MNPNSILKGEEVVIRHCAHCLNLCGSPTKICGGCKKRAYCSKECQRADWSIKGDGQRHINWCRRHECGEEDVDWEVVPIPNKGLGIRAKKLIPSGLKIIVEPLFESPNDHPGMKDLGPEGLPLELKFAMNLYLGENIEHPEIPTVAVRIARVNHSCQPNADTIYDETARVAVLFAIKDIQPGEEITISYYSSFIGFDSNPRMEGISPDLNVEEEFNYVKNRTLSLHGITCPTDCYCYDPVVLDLVKEAKQIRETLLDLVNRYKTEEALVAGERLLDIHRRLDTSWVYRAFMGFRLFQIAVRKSVLLPRAKEHIQSAVELVRKMCPYSEKLTKNYEKLLENPETDRNYLMIDRLVSDVIERVRTELDMS